MSALGFIGLGDLGIAMAGRLLDANYRASPRSPEGDAAQACSLRLWRRQVPSTAHPAMVADLNSREHRVTRRKPATVLAEEQPRLHRIPDTAHTVAFGLARMDRLLHHAHVCQTTGDSIRLTQALAGKGVMPLN